MAKLLDKVKASIAQEIKYHGDIMKADAAPVGVFYRLDLTEDSVDELAFEISQAVLKELKSAAYEALLINEILEEEDETER